MMNRLVERIFLARKSSDMIHIITLFLSSELLQSGKSVLEYQSQAKLLFRKLGPSSPRCSIETGPYLFQ